MKKARIIAIVFSLSLFLPFLGLSQKTAAKPNIIPLPNSMVVGKGAFSLDGPLAISYDSSVKDQDFLTTLISMRLDVDVVVKDKADMVVKIDKTMKMPKEGYTLKVSPKRIDIKAPSDAGVFYAIQTLSQLSNGDGGLYVVDIKDAPRFGYRGVMLDCSRHFMNKAFIKTLLVHMSRFKLNTFHWHLVDGGGWRMESKKYPLLQQKAVKRTESDWDKWWQGDRLFVNTDNKKGYGNYYTQDDIKEIVEYAAKMHINVIPEIEMPGHSNEIFAAYPNLSCSGKWSRDVSEVCPAKEDVYKFYEGILDEVMALFPSKYIHIGGDEANKGEWAKCPLCQDLMKKEGFTNVEQLQSYMIRRIEKYLNAHGREIIGWDEILEGGLAPGATVMSWRGEEGGISAAKMHHDVIMTPGKYLYLDFYQADPNSEPRAIGGYTPIKQLYSYNPVPKELTSRESKYILGAQANLWTEYVPNESHAEYMLYPRILALAEVDWTNQNKRHYDDFLRRVNVRNTELIRMGINAYPLKNIDITQKVDPIKHEIVVTLSPELLDTTIRYTLDGTTPTRESLKYKGGIVVKNSANIVASLFDEMGKPMFSPVSISVDYHKAMGKKVEYATGAKYENKYSAGGDNALVDGYVGGASHSDGRWQGFLGNVDVKIDLGSVQDINTVKARFMEASGAWIHIPGQMTVYTSVDGNNWSVMGKLMAPKLKKSGKPSFVPYMVKGQSKARYVKIFAENIGRKGSWLFVDEVVVH